MNNWMKGIYAAIALACVAVIGSTAFDQGVKRGSATMATVADARTEISTRIMAYVIKRNPDATIRDFSDFPEVLMRESDERGIDFRLILALIDKESQFNPKAIGKAGEIGLMQIMPSTGALVARNLGLPYQPRQGNDLGTLGVPRHNLRIGIAHLKSAADEFGGVNPTALRAYNRGSVTARENRPWDRYAEDIALKFVVLTQEIRP